MRPPLPNRFDEFVTRVSAPTTCGHDGCDRSGDFTLEIKLWAKGFARKPGTSIVAHMDVRRCSEHCWDVTPDKFWLPESKAMLKDALRSVGKAEPDFSTAEFSWVKAATALGGGLSVN